MQLELGALVQRVSVPNAVAGRWARRIREGDVELDPELSEKVVDMAREFSELRSRIARLNGGVAGEVAPLTTQERQQWQFFERMADTLAAEWADVAERLPEEPGG